MFTMTAIIRITFVYAVRTQYSQPGQTSADEVKKRDLRAELLAAEQEARDKKRKAEGKPPLAVENGSASLAAGAGDEESNKRRKLLQDALEMDKDDDEDSDGEDKDGEGNDDDDEYVKGPVPY